MAHSCFTEKSENITTSLRKNCLFCKKIFSNAQTLYTHLNKRHSDQKDSFQFQAIEHEKYQRRKQMKENYFYCKLCSSKYKTKSSYETHLSTHREKEASCEVCGRRFANVNRLGAHLDTHNNKSLPCDECGVLFKSTRDIKRHLKNVHRQTRNYQCDICEKKFVNPSKVNEHKQNVHLNFKPFVCEICELRCARFYNLQMHRKTVHGAAWMRVQNYRDLVESGNHPSVTTLSENCVF